jgi:hypothetical protein
LGQFSIQKAQKQKFSIQKPEKLTLNNLKFAEILASFQERKLNAMLPPLNRPTQERTNS